VELFDLGLVPEVILRDGSPIPTEINQAGDRREIDENLD
jgi:hypothetical protein